MAKKLLGKKKAVSQGLPEPNFLPENSFIEPEPEPEPSIQITPQQPNSSPYTSPVATLRVGTQNREYYVAQSLLQSPFWVENIQSWGGIIDLPDVDESTGHVVAHYLYTGTYQTLDDKEIFPKEEANVDFKRAFRAYITAETYKLSGLKELTERKIKIFGAGMNIFDVVDAARDDVSKLTGDDAWFSEYLDEKIKAAFMQDRMVFAKNDLFGRIDDIGLMRGLARRMMTLFSHEFSNMLAETCSVLEVPDDVEIQVEDHPVEDHPVEDHPIEDHPIEDGPLSELTFEEVYNQETNTEELSKPPHVEPESAPSPEDSWGRFVWPSTKKRKDKKGKRNLVFESPPPSQPLEPESEPEPEPEPDLDLEPEPEPILLEPEPPEIEPEPAQEEPPADLFVRPGIFQKKMTERELNEEQQAREQEEQEAAALTAQAAQAALDAELKEKEKDTWDEWGAPPVMSKNKNKKKKKNKSEKDIVLEPEIPVGTVTGEICPDRITHLAYGDGWRNCALCMARVEKLLPEMLM